MHEAPNPAVINLRAHHLLCTRTFAGEGYSASFVDAMWRVAELLRNPAQPVRIVAGLDDLCTACPHGDGLHCTKDGGDVADALDDGVASAIGISPDDTYLAGELLRSIERGIRDDLFSGICSRCSWYSSHCRRLLK